MSDIYQEALAEVRRCEIGLEDSKTEQQRQIWRQKLAAANEEATAAAEWLDRHQQAAAEHARR